MISITAFTRSAFPVETDHVTEESAAARIREITSSGRFVAFEVDGRTQSIRLAPSFEHRSDRNVEA